MNKMIETTEAIRPFEVRKHPMEQEVYVDNGSYYGKTGYVVQLDDWHTYEGEQRITRHMVCIRFDGKGCVWFEQNNPEITIVATHKINKRGRIER